MLSNVYKKLADKESKEIFRSRLLHSLTGDTEDMVSLVSIVDYAKEIRDRLKKFNNCECVFWGAGNWSNWIKNNFPDVRFKCYFDNQPKMSEKEGLPVYGAKDFIDKYKGEPIFVTPVFFHREIEEQLLSYGVEPDRIINVGGYVESLTNRQYFDLPELPHVEEEVFVDAGCFDGESVKNFVKWSQGRYKEIYSFEPDNDCYRECKEILNGVTNCTLINKGLWNSEATLSFKATGKSDSTICEDGETIIYTCRLDEELKDKRVTFIKMDIEGAEREALRGAEKIIREQKPKLAISIYHKKEDIWEIPGIILEMNPDYKFYIRHYSLRDAETVLYAF